METSHEHAGAAGVPAGSGAPAFLVVDEYEEYVWRICVEVLAPSRDEALEQAAVELLRASGDPRGWLDMPLGELAAALGDVVGAAPSSDGDQSGCGNRRSRA